MSVTGRMILLCLLAAGLLVLLLFVIGIYVYRDAFRRNMNPVLWTLVAALAPAFTGFIIYLLMRGHYPALECPVCRLPVEETYTVCPACKTRLKRTCTDCGFPVEDSWNVCPRCAVPLPEEPQPVTPPIRRKDRALFRVLLLAFLIPVLLFGLLCILNLSAVQAPVTMSQLTSYTEEEIEQFQELPEVWDWLQEVQERDPEGVYVLRYRTTEDLGYLKVQRTVYLIYRPMAGYMKEVNEKKEYDIWNRPKIVVAFRDTSDPRWSHAYYPLTRLSYLGNQYAGLKLIIDDQETAYELQDSKTDPDPLLEDLPWEAEYHIQNEEE